MQIQKENSVFFNIFMGSKKIKIVVTKGSIVEGDNESPSSQILSADNLLLTAAFYGKIMVSYLQNYPIFDSDSSLNFEKSVAVFL